MRRRVPRQGQGPGLRLTRAEPEVRADDIHTRLSIFERARLVRMCAGPHGVYYIIATRLVRRKICVEVLVGLCRVYWSSSSPLSSHAHWTLLKGSTVHTVYQHFFVERAEPEACAPALLYALYRLGRAAADCDWDCGVQHFFNRIKNSFS